MNQQGNKEKLKFNLSLSGTYWDKKPRYSILVDDKKMAAGSIDAASDSIIEIEFECELDEDAEHVLSIRLENKTNEDTVKTPAIGEPYVIEKDMLLNIHSIRIDDIDLGQLIWSASKFIGDDPRRPELTNCVNLGWNGAYILKFSSPFYLWLLENM